MSTFTKANKYAFEQLKLTTKKQTIGIGEQYWLRFNSDAKCTWTSSNKSIASVDIYGRVTGKKKGTVTITAHLYGETYKSTIIVK